MKLKFVNNLNEADAARGQRIEKLKTIHNNIKTEVEKNNYVFKGDNDRGFYIQPKFDYLSKISVIIDENNNYNVKIFDTIGKSSKQTFSDKAISEKDFYEKWKKEICPAAIKIIFDLTNDDILKLQAPVINEAVPKFLDNILNKTKDFVKNTVNKVVDSKDEKAANKQETKEFKQKINQLTTSLENILKSKAGKNKIEIETIKSKTNNSQIDFILKSNFVMKVIYETDHISTDKSIIISDCITSLNDHNNIGCSLNTFIKFLNDKLNLQINIQDKSNKGDVESNLKNILGSDILKIIGENLIEALDDIKIIDKYLKALPLVKNNQQGIALVKHYFYTNTDKKIELDDLTANHLYLDIAERKSFKSPLFNIIIKYCKKHETSVELGDQVADLVEFLTTEKFIKNKTFNDNSLIYKSAFITANIPVDDLQDIYKMHAEISTSTYLDAAKISEYLKKLSAYNPAINFPAAKTIKSISDLANHMIFNGDKIRNIEEIEEIFNLLTRGELRTIKAKKLDIKKQGDDINKLIPKLKTIFDKGDIKNIISDINALPSKERELALSMFANFKK